MHRHIVYPGSIPLETDLLATNRHTAVETGMALLALLGTGTYVSGLACTPTSPASLQVNVGPGSIFSYGPVDSTAYSSLAADTTDQIQRQGILVNGGTTLTITPPGTTGQSTNYLVEASYADIDANLVVLPYYNAANPAVAWSGPNNSGTPQNTVRQGLCVITLKAGVPAATGSQVTPAPDAGSVGLYVITVANGQSAITAGNISTYSGAPFISPPGATAGISGRLLNVQVFVASGSYTPTPGTLSAVVEVQGGGGAGGGVPATGSGQSGVAPSGTPGAFARVRLSSGTIGFPVPIPVPITVGAGGAAGAPGAGGNSGGTSSFGSVVSCPGGPGAGAGQVSSGAFYCLRANDSGPPSINGGVNILSGIGRNSVASAAQITYGAASWGAWSPSGLGGSVYGYGGAGIFLSTQSSAAIAGNAGGAGVVIVYEYA